MVILTIAENPILLSCSRLLVGLLIGKENLRLYDTLDWEQSQEDFSASDFLYPEYYTSKNFHGIQGGYLNAIAPVTYDAVTRFAAPPNEIKLRQQAIAMVNHQPQRILDLGCGTGSSTLTLKQAFPAAESIDTWLQALNFQRVQTSYVGWISQITTGFKPIRC